MTTHLYKGLNTAIRRILVARGNKAVHYGEIYEIINAENSLAICESPNFGPGLIRNHLTSAGGILSFATDELGYVTQKDAVSTAAPAAPSKVASDLDDLLAARGIVHSYDASDFDAVKTEPGYRTRQFVPDLILRKGTAYKKHKDALYAKQNGRCASCQRRTRIELCDVDHIVAHSQGGSDDAANLQVLCRDCNARKGSKSKNPKAEPGILESASNYFNNLFLRGA